MWAFGAHILWAFKPPTLGNNGLYCGRLELILWAIEFFSKTICSLLCETKSSILGGYRVYIIGDSRLYFRRREGELRPIGAPVFGENDLYYGR